MNAAVRRNIAHKALLLVVPAVAWNVLAGEYQWSNDASGNDPTTPYVWSQPSNWGEAGVPQNDLSDTITFANCAAGERSIAIPGGTVASFLNFGDVSQLTFVGGPLNIGMIATAGSSRELSRSFVYADCIVPAGQAGDPGAELDLGNVEICGDIVLRDGTWSQTVSAYGDAYHRLDLYANQAGEVRRNPGNSNQFKLGWGDYYVVAPHGGDAVTATWVLTAGSAFARLKEGEPSHVLCAGTAVSGPGNELANGTFLKRIFSNSLIELSEPAAQGGEVALTFAAFSPQVTQGIDFMNASGADRLLTLGFGKYREEDSYVVSVYELYCPKGETRALRLASSTGIPATLKLSTVNVTGGVVLSNADIEFGPTSAEGRVPGFADAESVTMDGAGSKARIAVPQGVTATLNNVGKIDGSFVKAGSGSLVLKMGDSHCGTTGDLLNTGALEVADGIVFIETLTEDAPTIQSLRLGATGRLELNGKTLAVAGTLVAAKGTVVSGPGKLVFADPSVDFSNITFENGASAAVAAPLSSGTPVYDVPSDTMPGDPALWMDAAQGVTETDGAISRWDDVRGAGYHFATNVGSLFPSLRTDVNGRKFVKITRQESATADEIEKTEALVWDVPVRDIRALFLVIDMADGGGTLLGSTKRLSTCSFYRLPGVPYYDRLVNYPGAADSVSWCDFYLNCGELHDGAFNTLGPYCGSDADPLPVLVELHPRTAIWQQEIAEADAFGFCNSGDGNNGGNRIYEVVVYTNALTRAERLQACEYLMRKHLRSHASYDRLEGVGGRLAEVDVGVSHGFDVAAGGLTAVDRFVGTGTFAKSGDGTLYLDDAEATGVAFRITEGVMKVRSVKVDADHLPEQAFLHFDASDATTMDVENGSITRINDRRGAEYPYAVRTMSDARIPLVTPSAVGGKTMIDFGPYSASGGQAMQFRSGEADYNNRNLRTTVAVFGTAKGGGWVAGDLLHEANAYGGVWRDGSSFANPLADAGIWAPNWFKSGNKDVSRWNLNGVPVANPTATGFSGGYDLVSVASFDHSGVGALGGCNMTYVGGQEFGEQIYFENTLTAEQIRSVEAYLNEKWFGVPAIGYHGAKFATLVVESGACVDVCGGSAIATGGVSGGGTVNGDVILSGGVADVSVKDGPSGATIDAVTVNGRLDVSAGGTVRLSGTAKLVPGTYVLAQATEIIGGDSAVWTVDCTSYSTRKILSVAVDGNRLVLTVGAPGFSILLR